MDFKFLRALASNLGRSGWLNRLAVISALVFVAQLHAAAATEIPTITNADDIWSVSPQLKTLPNPVRLTFTINYYDPIWGVMWAEENGRAFFVNTGPDTLPVKSGQRIRVEGTMVPSQGVDISKCRITLLTPIAPPAPLNAKGRIRDHKNLQCHIVTVEGYVDRQTEVDENHVLFETTSEGQKIAVRLRLDHTEPLPQLTGALVRFTGVYVVALDANGELATLALWLPSIENIQVVDSITNDPHFDLPPTAIENLLGASSSEMVTIKGSVVSQEPGQSITVRDQTGQITVQSPQTQSVSQGQNVTAIGFPFVDGTSTVLRSAHFKTDTRRSIKSSNTSDRLSLLRLINQVQLLSPEDASSGQAVRLTGMVTWASPIAHFIFLQDATGGIRIDFSNSKSSLPQLYDYIQIEGTTTRGSFSTEITASKYTPKGKFDLPATRLITLDQAMTGVEEGNWVELRGFVNAITSERPWAELSITTPSGEFTVRLPAGGDLQSRVGAVVRVKGTCSAVTNQAGQLTSIRLWSPDITCVQVEVPRPDNPFALPEMSIANLRRFHPLTHGTKPVRVTGQVIDQDPGNFVRIQNGTDVIIAVTSENKSYQLGDRIEMVGIAGHSSRQLVLRNAVARFIAAGEPLAAIDIKDLSTIDESLYGRVVRVEGRLLEVSKSDRGNHLSVQTRNQVIDIQWDHDNAAAAEIPIGAQLQLTGIYLIQYELLTPTEVFLRVRSHNDIVVLAQPSWWTARRALVALGLVASCMLVALIWLNILHRRVRLQTRQIRSQVETEAFLQARHLDVLANASDFIYTLDLGGRFTSYNPAGQRLISYTASEILGSNIRDHLAPEDVEQLAQLFKLDSQQDATASFQARFKHKDGRLLWTETSARLMRQHGNPIGFLAITRDISQRKELEDRLREARDTAEANTRAKSAFLANMSHEIRTPMNGVIGMSNLLLQTPLSDEQRDFSETIRNSAESLLIILNDILDFSKIEAGKLQFDSVDFELRQMVEDSLELMASRASSKGLELVSFIPQDLTNCVRGDPGRIRQVLLNLLGNAIKFTEKGEVVLSVSAEKETAKELHLRFEITDTGIGISSEVQATLFQPFRQADSSTTRKFGGTGLGLVISKQIVELMQGQIGVASTPGRGAAFWFTILLEKQPFDIPKEEPAKITALNGLRTLIVDDSATNRKIIQRYTVAWGMCSEQAHDGRTALDALRTATTTGNPYDLILLDYQMPEMDGFMLAREIQKDPAIAGPRMILLTSWDRRFSREELNNCGIVRMLVKPIRQQDLLGALLRCVRISHDTHPGLDTRTTPPINPPSTEPLKTKKRTALRILVAEDNIVNQHVSVRILKNLGYDADIAANGLEVIDALQRQPYDVIFMDGQMPELDGYEATRRVRRDFQHRRIHIVAMTANAMHGDRERCLDAGMDDYISKPTRPDDIAAALERAHTALKSKKPA
jgi:PAS domain S-box-containing protein